MGLLTFKGGLHPYDGKELSKDKPITEYLPQGELVYPLSQHIGAPAVACVKKGDRVLVGQKIAEAGGFVSANIYSSVSGTVKKIEPRMTVSGNKVNSVIVENDGEYETVSFQPVTEKTNEAIINAVKEAGIVGLGGAGFPTHVKLSPKEPDKIDTIIINAAECEPYITADYRCMMEIPEQLISGLNIMLSLFPKAKGVIGIEDNKPEAIAKLTEMCKSESRIEVAALKTKYPQGAERSLIYAVTGRAINSSMLPADAGCIVDNVATAIAIHEAITLGKPLYERVVTVTGDAIKNPGNFKVKNGTTAAELVEAAGGFLPEACEEYVNQAEVLTDGKRLYIPTEDEVRDLSQAGKDTLTEELLLQPDRETDQADGLVNINTASMEELCTLPGIGEEKARHIISYRESTGKFEQIEDIMKVEGIKEGLFGKIRDLITAG